MLIWGAFLLFILLMVTLDLGVFHRELKAPTIRDALTWTFIWISLALLFNVFVYFLYQYDWTWAEIGTAHLDGTQAASEFFLAYVLEKSLSVDNIFVIAMVFAYFRVPLELQRRVLFWGILGAVVLRGIMIAAGVALITRLDWITYLFGAFLLYTAIKILLANHYHIPNGVSLAFIVGILAVGVLASLKGASKDPAPLRPPF